MQQAVSARAPAHLWIVGILSLLWTSFGAYDYTMSNMRSAAYLGKMGDPAVILAWMDSMPLYAKVGWAMGVWAAVLGSVLLLLRSRYALYAFVLSIVGMVLSFGGQYLGPPEPYQATGVLKYIPAIVVLIGLAQTWYAWRETKDGVLR